MTEDEVKIKLEVKESYIEGEDGVGRINDAIMQKLGAEEGHSIVVESEEDSILLTIFGDNLIEENLISLRPGDREKLGVANGDKVTISSHKSVGEVLGDKKEALKEKLDIGQDDEDENEDDKSDN